MAVLLAALTFLIVAAICVAMALLTGMDRHEALVRKRLEAVQKAEKRGHVSLGLKLVRDELLSDVPVVHRFLLRWSWANRLREMLGQAGIRAKPGKIILSSGVLALGTYECVLLFHWGFVIALLAGAFAGSLPYVYVLIMRHRRLRAFEKRFPEALDLLTRAVRAGHAFSTGLEMIGKELAEPVAGEFRATFEEQNFGLPLRDALLNLAERVPIIDVRFFVTALLIQKETGGNLAEILEGLARVIRDRFRIYGEVRVRTAQGRLTAAILMALPPAMMLVIGLLNPGYMHVLYVDPMGPKMLIVAGILQVLGAMWLWKIVSIEV